MPRAAIIAAVVGLLVLSGPAAADPPARRPERHLTKRPGARAGRGAAHRRGRVRHESLAKRRARIAAYRASLARWRTPAPGAHATWQDGFRDITFRAVNTGDSVTVRPFRADGTLDPGAMAQMRRILRDQRADEDHEIVPRLVTVLYRLVVALDASEVNVISGFRQQHGRGHSRHGEGAAVDIVVPGVESDRVAEVARGLGHVGVGTYPTSGFVHIDVRDQSYFWVDRSGPGQRGRVVQVRPDEARAADAAYRPEQDRVVARTAADDSVTVGVSPVAVSRASTRPAPRHRGPRRHRMLRSGHR